MIVDRFVQALKRLIELGANLNDTVQKLRPYRNYKKKAGGDENLRQKMLAAIIKQRQERQKESSGHYNRYGMYRHYGQKQQQQPKKTQTEYCPQGRQNVLHLIQGFPHPKVVEYILSAGSVQVNQQDYLKRTPLHFFVKLQHAQLTTKVNNVDVLELLLRNKADPNILNINKESPFFLTVQHHKSQFFEHFLNHSKPQINLLTSKGETALILSVKRKYQPVFIYLFSPSHF